MNSKIPIGLKSVGVCLPDNRKNIFNENGFNQTVTTGDNELTTFKMQEIAFKDMYKKSCIDARSINQFIYMNDSFADNLYLMNSRNILNIVGVERAQTYNMFQGGNSSLLGCKMAIDHLKVNDDLDNSLVGASSHWEYHSEDRKLGNAILGDGAAVAHFEKGHEDFQFLSFSSRTIGKYNDINYLAIGGYRHPISEENIRNGEFVFKVHNKENYDELYSKCVHISSEVFDEALNKLNLNDENIDLFLLHSHTKELSESFINVRGIPNNKILETTNLSGYMGSAGVILGLEKMMSDTRISKGSYVAVVPISVDGNFSAAIIKV